MIKYVQYLIITWIITRSWKVSTGITNYLPHMHDEVEEPHGTVRLWSFKANVRLLELTYHVVVCIFGRQEETVNRESL